MEQDQFLAKLHEEQVVITKCLEVLEMLKETDALGKIEAWHKAHEELVQFEAASYGKPPEFLFSPNQRKKCSELMYTEQQTKQETYLARNFLRWWGQNKPPLAENTDYHTVVSLPPDAKDVLDALRIALYGNCYVQW